MLLVRTAKIKQYLKLIGRNQVWLAKEIGHSKHYLNQIINNKCPITGRIAAELACITYMSLDELFLPIRVKGKVYYFLNGSVQVGDELYQKEEFTRWVKAQLSKSDPQ